MIKYRKHNLTKRSTQIATYRNGAKSTYFTLLHMIYMLHSLGYVACV